MVCEALGLGPHLYCITWDSSVRFLGIFYERLFLLMQFPPHDKIVINLDLGFSIKGPYCCITPSTIPKAMVNLISSCFLGISGHDKIFDKLL